MRRDTIEVFCGYNDKGWWYWRLRAPNNRVVADGAEGYASKHNALRAARRMADRMTPRPRIEMLLPGGGAAGAVATPAGP